MKIFINKTNEGWICDRFTDEWYNNNPAHATHYLAEADIVWIMANWQWYLIPANILQNKKVVTTIHHIVPEKLDLQEFKARDKITNMYHVPCENTRIQIEKLTKKPVTVIPFWTNTKMWFEMKNKEGLRAKYGFSEDAYIIGSFQRDTEGEDLISPKLEKGPDIFCDIVEKLYEKNKKVQVCLAAWRRQYIISRLEKKKIRYNYYRLCDSFIMNELYNLLDLYLISSRHEGGPQAIVEAGLTKTPLVSTDVGLASNILAPESVYKDASDYKNAKPNVEYAYEKSYQLSMPHGFKLFHEMFDGLLK